MNLTVAGDIKVMAEHVPDAVERGPESIQIETKSGPEHRKNDSKNAAETRSSLPNLDKLRQHIESQAVKSQEVAVGEKEHKPSEPTTVNRRLKQQAYSRTLEIIRSKLGTGDRLASRILHQPLIDRVSTIGAQTIARPSGLLGGSTGALLGSAGLLMLTKSYGISYNYLLIFVFFGAGFVIGLLVEVIYRIIRPKRRQ